jgi:hypothetical protein
MSHYKPGMTAKDIIASVHASRKGIVLPLEPRMESRMEPPKERM